MDMDLNNRLTEDETLEQAYDIFLELVPSTTSIRRMSFCSTCSLKNAAAPSSSIRRLTGKSTSILISTLTSSLKWSLVWYDEDGGEINDIFARVLLCREKDHKLCHILWRE